MIPLWAAALLVVLAGAASALACGLAARRMVARVQMGNRREREQERQAFLGTIATGLAHELRNPLSTMRMHLQLLEEDWARPVTEREERALKRLRGLLHEVDRLEKILHGFLKFAMEQRLDRVDIDVAALLRELGEFLRPRFEAAGVELAVRAPPGLPVLRADVGLVRQALMNLLINALEAMPRGGRVVVEAANDRGHLVLRVADTGPGLPRELGQRVWDLYTSTKPSGTGLGLPMARKIVHEHGGTIEATSAPEGGAVFTIRLPLS